jgi:alpha-amylase/alpha-mannosidase (GH57 family)
LKRNMKKRNVCIHGHFYQPPRENPWLNKVEVQDSAHPYHDWNHRIDAECYARNGASRIINEQGQIADILNNYSLMSFNFGPTLLSWFELESPLTYKAILEADKESQKRFSGHGSAMAQVYNHIIMPLASQRDKETQVIWGIEDFIKRFGRYPEGMWLSETAVDTATLEVLAYHNIKFTVLSPYQAKSFRKLGDKDWIDASKAAIDPRNAYICPLPSGRSISLFFYDGHASKDVAFSGLLNSGEAFANRLKGMFSDDDQPQLVHIATDGESYGHHHRYGEMALSYCLAMLEEDENFELTVYGEYLEKFPPQYEVAIIEGSSWSCSHGVERWKSDCGCNSGRAGWVQAWRGPLRDAFDWLRDELVVLYEEELAIYDVDSWEIRNGYVQIVLNRSREEIERFLAKYFDQSLEEKEKSNILSLLEMQYHCMLMYTSCGWFFDEVSGLETVQDILYAARAVQLAEKFRPQKYEKELLRRLEKCPSNLEEIRHAASAYQKYIRPTIVDLTRVGAHFAIASLFENFPSEMKLFNYKAKTRFKDFVKKGKNKLIIGYTTFQSNITLDQVELSYAMLHLGELNLYGGVREFISEEALDHLHKNIKESFQRNDIPEIFSQMDHYFGSHTYSFWHLFKDEQKAILSLVMQRVMANTEVITYRMYEENSPIIHALKTLNFAVPHQLKVPADLAINTTLTQLLTDEPLDMNRLSELLDSANELNAELDLVSLNFLAEAKLTGMMRELAKNPFEITLLEKILEFLNLIEGSTISPEYWEARNITFSLRSHSLLPSGIVGYATQQGPLIQLYDELSQKLNLAPSHVYSKFNVQSPTIRKIQV